MLSLLMYVIGTLIIGFIIYKIAGPYKQKKNPFLGYFLALMIVFGISEILGILLTTLSLLTSQLAYLYWLDVITRIIYFIATAIVIQIPLYLYFPKSKTRYWASVVVLVMGLVLLGYNLMLDYQPMISPSGYIEWNAPFLLSVLMAVTLMSAWLFASYIFIRQFVLDKYKSLTPLFFGLGFFLTISGTISQDFATTNLEFIFIYLSMIIGGFLIFLGFYADKRQSKNYLPSK